MFLLVIWFFLILISAAILLPILRVFGVVNWKWKYIFAPIWVPLTVFFTWFLWLMIPIFVLSGLLVLITGSNPI